MLMHSYFLKYTGFLTVCSPLYKLLYHHQTNPFISMFKSVEVRTYYS